MDAVEDIKQKLSIEDVVSEYVQLKRAGRNLKGLSPFTAERTPSFMVSPEKQIWHDFSSGKGGNMFSFVMEVEGLDFKGALEYLARKAGVDLSLYRQGDGTTAKRKERLHEALELAAKFYQAHLKQNKTALEYLLKKRAFNKEIVLEFRLGYSPESGTALLDFLYKRGFSEDELKGAGLVTRRYRGPSDMFLGRVMVPLMDPFGRVIGFTARLLRDDPQAPKYINTPQTLLYDKGRHVFGLHMAKESIRLQKFAVVVEGNLDVIASHQAGVRNVVATAGTAMTEMHLKNISRFASDIRVAFDQDQAGLQATERTLPLASKVGVNLQVVTIPSGKDPDELIQKDPALWHKAIESPQYALDWLIERYVRVLDINSAQGKKKFTDIMLQVIRLLVDEVEKDHYLTKVSELVGVSKEALTQKFKRERTPERMLRKSKATPQQTPKTTAEQQKIEDHMLALLMMRHSLRTRLQGLGEMIFSRPESKRLYVFLTSTPDFDGDLGKAKELQTITEYVKILSFQYEELYQDLDIVELEYELERLRIRLIEHYVKQQKRNITGELGMADETRQKELLSQAKNLDELLRHKETPRGR